MPVRGSSECDIHTLPEMHRPKPKREDDSKRKQLLRRLDGDDNNGASSAALRPTKSGKSSDRIISCPWGQVEFQQKSDCIQVQV